MISDASIFFGVRWVYSIDSGPFPQRESSVFFNGAFFGRLGCNVLKHTRARSIRLINIGGSLLTTSLFFLLSMHSVDASNGPKRCIKHMHPIPRSRVFREILRRWWARICMLDGGLGKEREVAEESPPNVYKPLASIVVGFIRAFMHPFKRMPFGWFLLGASLCFYALPPALYSSSNVMVRLCAH